MNGDNSKLPTSPPLPLSRHFPQRGQRVGASQAPLKGELPPQRLRGAVGTRVFMKSQANTHNPTWLPDGGAGRPNGLTEGVWFVEWKQLKATNGTPFAASRHFPQRGQRGPLRIRLGAFRLVSCVPPETPPALCAVLSFALSSCTPFCEWLHLLNLSGEVKNPIRS